jgi:hypothetical protein
MFFRYRDHATGERGPRRRAARGSDRRHVPAHGHPRGETLAQVDRHTAVTVMSDHGFKAVPPRVNLNAWLLREGLLAVKEGGAPGEYLSAIDWSRTRAYALGLGSVT